MIYSWGLNQYIYCLLEVVNPLNHGHNPSTYIQIYDRAEKNNMCKVDKIMSFSCDGLIYRGYYESRM
jgi:hypothetical protein